MRIIILLSYIIRSEGQEQCVAIKRFMTPTTIRASGVSRLRLEELIAMARGCDTRIFNFYLLGTSSYMTKGKG